MTASRWLEVFALGLAFVTCVAAITLHQRASKPADAWAARFAFLISASIVVGTLPGLLFPSTAWVRIVGSLLSAALTVAALPVLVRQHRALPRRQTG